MGEIEWTQGAYSVTGSIGSVRAWTVSRSVSRNADHLPYVLTCKLPGIKPRLLLATEQEAQARAERQLKRFRELIAPADA